MAARTELEDAQTAAQLARPIAPAHTGLHGPARRGKAAESVVAASWWEASPDQLLTHLG
jgi:hypothetical protein